MSTDIFSSYEIDDRMRSISMNAVQQGRIAKGRGNLPILDRDARIQNMIERLLHELTQNDAVNMSAEHNPLVDQYQPEIGNRISRMSEILDKLEDDLTNEQPKIVAPSKTTAKK